MAASRRGIVVRHSRSCRTGDGGSCNCEPAIEAWVFDRHAVHVKPDGSMVRGKKIRKTFTGRGALTAAKA